MNTNPISRRTALKGVGTLMALPFLESFLPRGWAASAPIAAAPRRVAFLYVPNGIHMPDWTPSSAGKEFETTPTLAAMAPYREDMLLLSGLACDKARANGDGAGDHARAGGAFLTGAQPRKTAGLNFQAGVSADQIYAQRFGDRTRLPSLELGIEKYRGAGNCDSGYSCVYEHTLAWRSPNLPLPTEVSPREIFDRLFSDSSKDPARARRNQLRTSVLDAVLEDAHGLSRQLGGSDQQKLDQYLDSVRELEKRIELSESLEPVVLPDGTIRPARTPTDLSEHIRLMSDLMALAFQTDVTRVITFMLGREGSEIKYNMVGVTEGHHTSTHHQGKAELIENVRKINRYHVEQLAYLVGKLKSIPEGEGTLLDNCMIAYGSGIGDGNRHTHADLPILLAGKGGGTIRTGQHIRLAKETPLANLWLALLERMGVSAEAIGDSTGPLPGLG